MVCSALGAPTKTRHGRAKARGPDPPTLGSSLARRFAGRRWLQSPVHRGERAISRKPSRRECRVAPAGPVVPAACVFLLQAGHGCSQHPAFPAPSVLPRAATDASPGQCHAAGCETVPYRCLTFEEGRREANAVRGRHPSLIQLKPGSRRHPTVRSGAVFRTSTCVPPFAFQSTAWRRPSPRRRLSLVLTRAPPGAFDGVAP
jgi:hypothetical protein